MNRNFYLLWTSQILSQVTVNVMNFLLLARIYQITGSTIATSLLWVAYSLPTIFFGPIGATTVDIYDRKKILVLTNLLQAVVLVIYYFTHENSIFFLYIVVIAYSFFNQFYIPAEMSSLPSVVKEKDLPKANSLFFLTQQLTLVIGFGFAGLIEKLLGFKASLMFCSILLFIAFIAVSLLPRLQVGKKIPETFEKLLRTFFDKIIEGYLFIKNKKSILYPLLLLFLIQVGLAIIVTILPQIATDLLKVDVSYSGLLIVVPVGVGTSIGAVVINKLLKRNWRKKNIIEIGLLTLSVAIIILIFGDTIISPIAVLFIGLGFVAVNIPTLTFLQQETPSWLRGRVFGNLFFFITLATIIPVIFSGIISEVFGVKSLLTLLSLGAIFVLVYSFKKGNKLIMDNF